MVYEKLLHNSLYHKALEMENGLYHTGFTWCLVHQQMPGEVAGDHEGGLAEGEGVPTQLFELG